MKLNQDKCYLIVSGHIHENLVGSFSQLIIQETENKKTIGHYHKPKTKLNYVTSIQKKGWEKLSVLARLSYYMGIKQKRIVLKIFTECECGYFPLIIVVPQQNFKKHDKPLA